MEELQVQLDIVNVNDNAPEIVLTSVLGSISENAELGTVVELNTVRDLDSGRLEK